MKISKFADLPIARKFFVILLGTTLGVLLTASIAFVILNLYNFRTEELHKLSALCKIMGQSCSPSLIFDDRKSAEKALQTYSFEAPTVKACIYKANGEVFANYTRRGENATFPKMENRGWVYRDGKFNVFEPIWFDNKIIGMSYICSDLSILMVLMRNTMSVTAFILLLSFLFAFLLSTYLHPFISKPILELTQLAQKICGQKCYSERVQPYSGDEMGQLMACFNQMLDQIQARDEELARMNSELETKVQQRTSEVQKLNLELRKRVNELESVNSELETFAYSISHDLRAPVRHIDSFARIMAEKFREAPPGDKENEELLSLISGAAVKMGCMIDSLLVFSRTSRAVILKRETPLKELAQSVMTDLLQGKDTKRIEWKIGDLPSLKVDAAMLRVVFTNLFSNALKFTSKRDRSIIETACVRDDDNHQYVFSVKDNGAGFDMGFYNRLFGVFQRLHRSEEFDGHGIGLALVRRIIDRHGGRTWAESKVDVGSTFYFSLPISS